MYFDVMNRKLFRTGEVTLSQLAAWHDDYFLDFRKMEVYRSSAVTTALKNRIQTDVTHSFLNTVFKGVSIRDRVIGWIDRKFGVT